MNGKFKVEVSKNENEYSISATIPDQSTAVVLIPDSYKKILFNEQLIWDNKELKNKMVDFLGMENGYYQFKVENSQFRFTAR